MRFRSAFGLAAVMVGGLCTAAMAVVACYKVDMKDSWMPVLAQGSVCYANCREQWPECTGGRVYVGSPGTRIQLVSCSVGRVNIGQDGQPRCENIGSFGYWVNAIACNELDTVACPPAQRPKQPGEPNPSPIDTAGMR